MSKGTGEKKREKRNSKWGVSGGKRKKKAKRSTIQGCGPLRGENSHPKDIGASLQERVRREGKGKSPNKPKIQRQRMKETAGERKKRVLN